VQEARHLDALHVMIVRELGEGRVPTVAQALRSAAARFPHAIAACVVYALLAIGGTLLRHAWRP